jgi:hypothetical protein
MSLSLTWSFIMAGAILVGLFTWIFIVLRADRQLKQGPAHGDGKHREVMGGQFDAVGGRQVAPRRDAPADTE